MAGKISPDKTRVSVSLRTKSAKEFIALCRSLGLPYGFLSSYVDHCIIALLPTLQAIHAMRDSGRFTEAEVMAAIYKGVADSEKDKDLQMELFGKK